MSCDPTSKEMKKEKTDEGNEGVDAGVVGETAENGENDGRVDYSHHRDPTDPRDNDPYGRCRGWMSEEERNELIAQGPPEGVVWATVVCQVCGNTDQGFCCDCSYDGATVVCQVCGNTDQGFCCDCSYEDRYGHPNPSLLAADVGAGVGDEDAGGNVGGEDDGGNIGGEDDGGTVGGEDDGGNVGGVCYESSEGVMDVYVPGEGIVQFATLDRIFQMAVDSGMDPADAAALHRSLQAAEEVAQAEGNVRSIEDLGEEP
jgi:hypothetical protein